MLLEIDMGNTYIKWRLVDAGLTCKSGRNLTSEDEFGWFISLNSEHKLQSVLISSVAGFARLQSLQQLIRLHNPGLVVHVAKVEPVWMGVRFVYQDVTRLGVDRALAMIAAYRRYPKGVMVVDAGSAMTADLVNEEGEHLGGYIMPGLPLLSTILAANTAQLPLVKTDSIALQPGCSTGSCIASGVGLMAIGALSMLESVAASCGIKNMVMTGGDGDILAQHCQFEVNCHPDLVFEGLECVFGYQPVQNKTREQGVQ